MSAERGDSVAKENTNVLSSKAKNVACAAAIATIFGIGGVAAAIIFGVGSSTSKSVQPSAAVEDLDLGTNEWPASTPNRYDPHACIQPDCTGATSIITSTLNPYASPCSDFYSFVCGNYPNESSSVLAIITTKLYANAERILLKMPVPARGQTPTQKAAALYRSCLNIIHDKFDNTGGLRHFMSHLGLSLFSGEWREILGTIVRLNLQYQMPTMLSVTLVDTSLFNGRRQMKISLDFNVLLDLINTRQQTDLYTYYTQHLEAYGLTVDTEASEVIWKRVIDLENHIIALSGLYMGEPGDYVFQTIDQLGTSTRHVPVGTWDHVISQQTGGQYVSTDQVLVILKDLKYFDKLYALEDDGLRFLTTWIVLANLAQVSSSRVAALYSRTHLRNRCFADVISALEVPALAPYLFTTVPQEALRISNGILEHIRSSVLKEILSAVWLEPMPKSVALRKVRAMQGHVGFPNSVSSNAALALHYGGYPDVGSRFLESMLLTRELNAKRLLLDQHNINFSVSMANAYYYTMRNIMIIPAAIIQPPVFFLYGPASLNYGGLGHVLSHEMMHAFDVEGGKRDEWGQYSNWWTPNTRAHYADKTLCLRQSHQSYNMQRRSDQDLNTNLDSENLADFVGLTSAFTAYKELGDARVLDELPYNTWQLFFIASCLKWCSGGGGASTDSRYSTARARCNVPLTHLPEFAEAFKCPLNSPMNARARCSFW